MSKNLFMCEPPIIAVIIETYMRLKKKPKDPSSLKELIDMFYNFY